MRQLMLLATAAALIGHWEGAISLMGIDLEIQVDFTGSADSLKGTIDIPMQGVDKWQLRDVQVRGDSVTFLMPAQGPPSSVRGIVRGDSIIGEFLQPPITASFRLARATPAPTASAPALPYDEEEVQVPSGNVTLAGTLTRPRGPGPFPAVVFVTGSGAQNRDENVLGFKPFAILADRLTRDGIVVLRCDDRGFGKSTGNFASATARDFADDLRAQIRFLAARTGIDRRRIGALGHSEGGLIGPMVAAGSDSVAFLVLLGAPGIRGDSVILDQGERIMRAAGLPDSARALNRTAQERAFAAAATGRGWDEARTAAEAVLRFMGGSLVSDSLLAAAVDAEMEKMKSPWMKSFLFHEPAPVLQKVRCPVLALFGANDLQVAPEVNAAPLERALRKGGNRDVTVRVIPRANHVFQETDNGSPLLYGTLKKEFVPGLLDTVSTWVTARTRPGTGKTSAKAR